MDYDGRIGKKEKKSKKWKRDKWLGIFIDLRKIIKK